MKYVAEQSGNPKILLCRFKILLLRRAAYACQLKSTLHLGGLGALQLSRLRLLASEISPKGAASRMTAYDESRSHIAKEIVSIPCGFRDNRQNLA